MQRLQKSSRLHLQETAVDSEDSSEPVESGSSSDNEVYNYICCMTACLPFSLVS